MVGFPSGQRGQTVNLLATPSKVRILLPPSAVVAELADAQDLKSCGTYTPVPVRFRSTALSTCYRCCLISYVGVAQLDRASGYGPEGREFESSRPRKNPYKSMIYRVFFYAPYDS